MLFFSCDLLQKQGKFDNMVQTKRKDYCIWKKELIKQIII